MNLLRGFLFFCILLLVAGTTVPALAAVSILPLDDNSHYAKLGGYLQFADATADAIEPAAAPTDPAAWTTLREATLNLGYRQQPVWLQLDFQTASLGDTHWLLEVANSQLDQLYVYVYRDDTLIQTWHSGDRQPFAQRPVPHRHFLFPLLLEPDHHYRLLLHVSNSEAMEVPLLLATQQHFAVLDAERSTVNGVFYGVLLIIAAYSLMLYLVLLDRSYVFYVSYVVTMLLFFLWQDGILYQYLFPDVPVAQHLAAGHLSVLIFASIALFFRDFLHLPKKVPLHWLAYKSLLVIHVLLCTLLWWLPYQAVIALMVVNTVLSTLMAVLSIVRLAIGGARSAQIVLIGWALLLFCLLFFTAAKAGLIYNDFMALHGLRLGISVEILIFSFALAFRINQEKDAKEKALRQVNIERNERMRAQELALQAEKETSRIREAALLAEKANSEQLQRLVEARTADLENTLANLEQAHHELERLSALDSLTGVANRRSFDTRLTELWTTAQRFGRPLSLLMVDIDHFKQVNDTFGHPCGDYVLKTFAHMLRDVVQRPTDFIARYGGEEFAILLPETPREGAAVVANLLVQQAQRHPFRWGRDALTITASIGVACQVPAASDPPDTLITQADAALYCAKRNGRNRCAVFSDALSQDAAGGGA